MTMGTAMRTGTCTAGLGPRAMDDQSTAITHPLLLTPIPLRLPLDEGWLVPHELSLSEIGQIKESWDERQKILVATAGDRPAAVRASSS